MQDRESPVLHDSFSAAIANRAVPNELLITVQAKSRHMQHCRQNKNAAEISGVIICRDIR